LTSEIAASIPKPTILAKSKEPRFRSSQDAETGCATTGNKWVKFTRDARESAVDKRVNNQKTLVLRVFQVGTAAAL
jgi:hypothetical protein